MAIFPTLRDGPVSHRRVMPPAAIGFLLLTLAVSLLWSHFRLMWEDEVLELWTDRVASLAQLVHIQRTVTIALEPIVYHAFSHAAIRAFGVGAFAVRLPALCGFLLMQVCVFVFMRRIVSERGAVFAMAFPALTYALYYSTEARPYGLVLGWIGVAMVCWQTAARRAATQRSVAERPGDAAGPRAGWLVMLALAIGLTLNTHYYGVLLLVPLWGAELYRLYERRRLHERKPVDWPMVAALVAGMACFAFTLPFAKAAAEYHKHFFDENGANYRQLVQMYRALFLNYTDLSLGAQRVLAMLLAAGALLLVFGFARQVVRNRQTMHARGAATVARQHQERLLEEGPLRACEIVFIVLLAALPVFAFLMAHYVTHAIQNRYALAGIIGITCVLAIALTPVFRSERAGKALLVLLAVAIAAAGMVRIRDARQEASRYMASLVLSPENKAMLMANPNHYLYFAYLGTYTEASYYEPDPDVKARMALIYSRDEEVKWVGMDTMSLMAWHASLFTGQHMVSYETVVHQPGEHVFLLTHGTQEWFDQELAVSHTPVQVIGHAFSGDVTLVRFAGPPAP